MTTEVVGKPSPLLAGRYRVESMLGKGGMAKVYAAQDVRLGRTVAVKIFRPEADAADRLARRRFDEEARLLANLNHPNLVPVYDAGTDGARAFLVMQLVNGPSLRGILGRGPIPPPVVIRLGAQLATTLAYVHSRGVLHRDVKPSNVLLGERGKPYLTDFGLARLIGAGGITRSGEMVGTAAYLSPEQVRGDHVGPVADVYSLGLVLLECVTGKIEYRGTEMESALARLSRQPRIPAEVPQQLGDIIAAMTARSPIARPSAATCGDWLKQLTDGVPLNPPPPPRQPAPQNRTQAAKPSTPDPAGFGNSTTIPAVGFRERTPSPLTDSVATTQLSAARERRGCRGWFGAITGVVIGATVAAVAMVLNSVNDSEARPQPAVVVEAPAGNADGYGE